MVDEEKLRVNVPCWGISALSRKNPCQLSPEILFRIKWWNKMDGDLASVEIDHYNADGEGCKQWKYMSHVL